MEMDKAILDHQTRIYFHRLLCSDPAHQCQDSEEERISRKHCKADKKYMVDSNGKPYTVHTSSAATGRVDTEMTKILVEEVQARADRDRDRAMGLKMPVLDDAARSTASATDGKVDLRTPTPRKVTFDVPGAYPSVPTRPATTTDPVTGSRTPTHDAEMAAKRRPTTTAEPRAPANTTTTALTNTNDSPGPYTSTPNGKYGIKTTVAPNAAATGGRRIPVKRLVPSPLATSSTPEHEKNVDAPKATVTCTTDDALPTAKVKIVEMPVKTSSAKGKARKGGDHEAEGEGWVEVDLEDDDWELV